MYEVGRRRDPAKIDRFHSSVPCDVSNVIVHTNIQDRQHSRLQTSACRIRHALTVTLAGKGLREPDFIPIVKLFTPDAACTWLLTELDPHDEDLAFGLCDLGMGFPELGSVRVSELESVRGRLGLPIERDVHFRNSKTLSVLAEEARLAGSIRA